MKELVSLARRMEKIGIDKRSILSFFYPIIHSIFDPKEVYSKQEADLIRTAGLNPQEKIEEK